MILNSFIKLKVVHGEIGPNYSRFYASLKKTKMNKLL